MSIAAIWPLRGITGDIGVAMAMRAEAEETGYVTYQAEYRDDLAWLRTAIQQFSDRRVDALILWCHATFLRELVGDLNALPMALVASSNEPVTGLKADLLVLDRYRAIEQVVAHFALSGRKRPVIVRGDHAFEQAKADVFCERCRHHGLSVDQRSIIVLEQAAPTPDLVARYRRGFKSHFRDGIDADALFCFADEGAMTAVRFLQDRGKAVPDDVAVVGWNNLPTAILWRPALASVDRCHKQVISTLREMLFSRLKDPDLPPRQRTVPMRFTWRESAGGNGAQGESGPGGKPCRKRHACAADEGGRDG